MIGKHHLNSEMLDLNESLYPLVSLRLAVSQPAARLLGMPKTPVSGRVPRSSHGLVPVEGRERDGKTNTHKRVVVSAPKGLGRPGDVSKARFSLRLDSQCATLPSCGVQDDGNACYCLLG
jgi:hypothetical protein